MITPSGQHSWALALSFSSRRRCALKSRRRNGGTAPMDPTFLSATQLAELVRSREIGALELLDHYIARTEQLDGRINAVVVRDFDRARARAKALDAQPDKTAPLFGVPTTVKESFDVAGLPTTLGHVELRNNQAELSSLSVRRLESAGAVIFGKTNVPVDLADWQSYNPVYGTTSNPWNKDHTPGGSSGGSAAALAAGLTGFEMGSDIGGSIPGPGPFFGAFGHKPPVGPAAQFRHPADQRRRRGRYRRDRADNPLRRRSRCRAGHPGQARSG